MGSHSLLGARSVRWKPHDQCSVGRCGNQASLSSCVREATLLDCGGWILRVEEDQWHAEATLLHTFEKRAAIRVCRPWERWDRGEQPIESCTILTTKPNDLVQPIHDR